MAESKSTFLSRSRTLWEGIPLWAIMLVTGYMVYVSVGPIKAMIFHGDWPLPQPGDIKIVEGQFIDGGGQRAAYRVQKDNSHIVRLACIPESAGAECLAQKGYSIQSLPGRRATVEYFYVRNYAHPSITNIMVSAVIDNRVVLHREQGLQDLVKWKKLELKIDWVADSIYFVPASLAWFMLGTAWFAKLASFRRGGSKS